MNSTAALVLFCSFISALLARPRGNDEWSSESDEWSSESDETGFSEEIAARERRHAGHHHHHLPQFAKNADDDAKMKLKEILTNGNLTRQQLDEEVTAWAQQQGEDVLEAYAEFKEKVETAAAAMKQALEDSSLSDTVKEALQKIENVFENESLTRAEVLEEVKSIKAGLSAENRKEIKEFMKENKVGRLKRQAEESHADLPDIFKAMSEEDLKSLEEIYKDRSQTKQQITDRVNEWAENQGPEIKESFDAMHERVKKIEEIMKQKVEESSLSDEAKSVIEAIEAVHENMDITPLEDGEQTRAIMESQDENVRTEIQQFLSELAQIN